MPIVKKLNFGHVTAMRYTFHCHCMYSVRLGWCIEVHQMYFSLARKRYTTCLNVLYCRNVAKQKCWRTIYHLRFALLMVPAYEMILKSSGKVVTGYRHTCNNSQGGKVAIPRTQRTVSKGCQGLQISRMRPAYSILWGLTSRSWTKAKMQF